MVDSFGKKPEFSSLLDSEDRIKKLRLQLNEILELLVESNSFAEPVPRTYQRRVSKLRSNVAEKLQAAFPDELMTHEATYLEGVVEGNNQPSIDIKLIIDIEGSLKMRNEYIQKNDSEGTILDEVKFRDDLLIAIDGFVKKPTSMNFIKIAVMVNGYLQLKKTHKNHYSFGLDNLDIQLLPICNELKNYSKKYLNSLIHANNQTGDKTVNLSLKLKDLYKIQDRIRLIAGLSE